MVTSAYILLIVAAIAGASVSAALAIPAVLAALFLVARGHSRSHTAAVAG